LRRHAPRKSDAKLDFQMFSIDFPEIIIIFALALVVLGPKKLPGAAAKIGRWVGRARSMARQFREQLEQEVSSAETAMDIRKSVDSAAKPAQKTAAEAGVAAAAAAGAAAAAAAAQRQGAPHEAPSEGIPQGAVEHGSATAEAIPTDPATHEPMPYESYGMPPPEGYEPAPQQLTFDAQLHDTALPPVSAAEAAARAGHDAPASMESHSSDVREWLPESQTWMASAGWETAEPAADAAAPTSKPEDAATVQPSSTPRQGEAHGALPRDSARESASAPSPSRTAAVENDDR